MNQEPSKSHGIRWGIIFLDLCILLLLSGVLMGIAIGIQQIFSVTNNAQTLISSIQKSKLDNGQDPVFLQVLDKAGDNAASLINTADFSGRTPLMWAAYAHYNNPELTYAKDKIRIYYVGELLSRPGINAKMRDHDGWTALHWSSWSGLPSITQKLIDSGLDVNLPEKNGYTPAMLAAMRGNDKAIAYLINAGADLNAHNKKGETPLDLAKREYKAYQANFDLTKTHVWVPNNPGEKTAEEGQEDTSEHAPGTGKYVDVRGEAFRNTIQLLQQKAG